MKTRNAVTTVCLTSQSGHTLLEVLIALLIMGIISVAIFQTYIVQHENYITQENVTNVQQNARAGIQELAKQIRMAGFALPIGVNPIRPANTNPDSITVTYRTGTCDASLSATMGGTADVLTMGTSVTCFAAGDYVYIVHPDSGGGEWFQIGAIDTVTKQIQPAVPLSKVYTLGAIVVPLQQVTFFIDDNNPASPNLMVLQPGGAPQVYSEGISDFQISYRMKNGLVLDDPAVIEDIREVLISLTGQSSNAQFDDRTNHKNTREFSTSVFLRNIDS